MNPRRPKYIPEIADRRSFLVKVRVDEPLLDLCSLSFGQIDGAYADICNHSNDQWPQIVDGEPYECQIDVIGFRQAISFDQLDQWMLERRPCRHANLRELAALYGAHQLDLQDLSYVLAFGQFFALPDLRLPAVITSNQSTYLRMMHVMSYWPNKVSFMLVTDLDPTASPPLSS